MASISVKNLHYESLLSLSFKNFQVFLIVLGFSELPLIILLLFLASKSLLWVMGKEMKLFGEIDTIWEIFSGLGFKIGSWFNFETWLLLYPSVKYNWTANSVYFK